MAIMLRKGLLIVLLVFLLSSFSFARGITPASVPAGSSAPPEIVDSFQNHFPEYEPNTLILQLNPKAEVSLDAQALSSGVPETGLVSLDLLLRRHAVERIQTAALLQESGVRKSPNLLKLELGPGHDPLEVARIFSQNPHVELAEPNYLYYSSYIPDDPYFPEQWGLHNQGQWYGSTPDADIDAPEAWDIERGDPSIIIAVIDTGVMWSHSDLAANIWSNPGEIPGNGIDDDGNNYIDDVRGWDFVTSTWVYPGEDGWPEDNDPSDFDGHGTHVAGIAAAVGGNGYGGSGVCPNCTIMPLRAGFKSGDGLAIFYLFDVANAVYYAANNGARVINMSIVGMGMPLIMDQAIQYAYEREIVMVASAGNHNDDRSSYPAAYPQVISVAATDWNDQRTPFSAYGYEVDLAAPGFRIWSTYPYGEWTLMNGTSMAAPMTAGAAGLVLSQNPHFTADQVRSILVSTADPKPFDRFIGSGRLNAHRALQMTNVPQALIQLPARHEFLTGLVSITGTAGGSGFSHYIVDYGSGDNPDQWHHLHQSSTPVSGNTLTTWNTASIPNGSYLIRLRVVDSAGNTNLVLRAVYIQHDLLYGWPKYVGGADPLAPLIADVDGDGSQELVVAVKETAWVYVWRADGTTLPGWPVRIDHEIMGSPASADLTGDGKQEIVLATSRNVADGYAYSLNVLRHDGTPLEGWPVNVGKQSLLTPALGDINGDGRMEIVVSTNLENKYSDRQAGVFVYTFDGNLLSGWPKTFPISENFVHPWTSGPVLGDLTGNGILDIGVGVIGGQVHAWDGSGVILPGWPNMLDSSLPSMEGSVPKLVLGDVDNDGRLEVVAGNEFSNLYVWKANGDLLPGWPFHISNQALGFPALGDLNGDGKLEIVAHVNNNLIFAWRFDGSILPGWPVWVKDRQNIPSGAQPLIVDVNGDGQVEVVFSSFERAVLAYQADGSPVPGWAKPMWGHGLYSPSIGDLTGDGQLELAAGSFGWFYIWKLNTPAGMAPWSMFQADAQRTGRYHAAPPVQPPPPTSPAPSPTPPVSLPPTPTATPTESPLPTPTPPGTPPSAAITPTPTLAPGVLPNQQIYIPQIFKP